MLNGLSLFSGIGGIDLALEPWVRPIAYCENNRYAQAVLLSLMREGRIPIAPISIDVRALGGHSFGSPIDIIAGGCPCQDFSLAGDGAGLVGERGGLFFEVIRLVSELRPKFVFLENVPAFIGRGFERISMEFTALGYDSRWTIVSAAEVGASHLRERWFFMAHHSRSRLSPVRPEGRKISFSSEIPLRENWAPLDPFEAILGGDVHGVPLRAHRIERVGNAVVPHSTRKAFQRLIGFGG